MNKLIIAVLSFAVMGGTLFGVTHVFAQESASDPHDSLIQRIAQKFGLNEAEVRGVFEEERKSHHADMTNQLAERLSQSVTNGKLTEKQKAKILAKHEEMRNNYVNTMRSFYAMEPEARRSAMEQKRTKLESWAAENDINPEFVHGMRGNRNATEHMGHIK